MTDAIPFVDLKAQYALLKSEIDARIHAVLEHGQYIQGPEIAELEAALNAFCGARHAISCSSGTDALLMPLMASGIGANDAVFMPAFTFTATAEVALLLGAEPVFTDVRPGDFNIDPQSLRAAISEVKRAGRLKPRAIIAVDLYGLPADYAALNAIAAEEGLLLIADAAQSFGGALGNRRVGTLAPCTATSFFPAKPLGCYGDGGAIFTDDPEMAEVLRSIRLHGKGGDKYDIVRTGINGRLDTMQAAILLAKLPSFAAELAARDALAQRYNALLADSGAILPLLPPEAKSAWAQYTLRLPAGRRDAIAARLKAEGIPTAIYYPRPMHLQPAYRRFGRGEGSLAQSEQLAAEVLSLPMHPFMAPETTEHIAEGLRRALLAG